MASPVNTRTDLSNLLKIVYEKNMNEGIRNLVFLFAALSKNKVTGKGKQYTFATHLGRNTMVASRSADDYVETGLAETVVNGTVNNAYVHIPFEITNDLMEASKGDPVAFADGMELVQRSARESMKRDLNRQSAGDQRGILATVTVTENSGGTAARDYTVDSTKYLEAGMLLDAWNGAALSNVTRRNTPPVAFKVVNVVNETTVSMILSDGGTVPTVTANDVLIRKANAYVNTTRFCYETNGLRLMADDGTLDPTGGLHGISSSSYAKWKGINKDGSGYDASPALISAMGIQFRRWSPTFFNTIWCHDNQAHGLLYGNEGSYKDKRFVDASPTDIGASYEDVVINVSGQKVKVKTDLDLPEDTIYFFDTKVLGMTELWPVKLIEQADGMYLTPWRDGTGQRFAQVGFYGWSGNFFTRIRQGIGRVYSLNKPASLPW